MCICYHIPLPHFPATNLPLRSSALRHAAMAAAAVPGRALEPLGSAQRRGEAGRLRRQCALQRRGLHLRRNVAARGSWSWSLGSSVGWDGGMGFPDLPWFCWASATLPGNFRDGDGIDFFFFCRTLFLEGLPGGWDCEFEWIELKME